MTTRFINAQDLSRTRLCTTFNCPNDAETNHHHCDHCQRAQKRRERARKATYARTYRQRINHELALIRATYTESQP